MDIPDSVEFVRCVVDIESGDHIVEEISINSGMVWREHRTCKYGGLRKGFFFSSFCSRLPANDNNRNQVS
jgi:hypothetical protein